MTVQETIDRQNAFVNLPAWHNAGYRGQGVVVWNTEGNGSEHSKIVTRRIKDAAPECTVIEGGLAMASDRDTVDYAYVKYQGEEIPIEDFIVRFNVDIVTRSVGGREGTGGADSVLLNSLKEKYNLVFFNAAGNDSEAEIGGALPSDVAIWCGAITLINGTKPVRAYYSSVGDELDFMGTTGVWGGTSFAAPYLAGMCALLKQKYGKWITQDFVYEYFKSHSLDLGTPGDDDYYGWGMPVMGDPTMKITLTIGQKIVRVDDIHVELDQPAVIDKSTNRTLVPLRAIAELLGCAVSWDQATQTVTIIK